MLTSPTKWDNRNISPNTQKAAEQKSTAREPPLKVLITKHQSPKKRPEKQPTARELPLKGPGTKYQSPEKDPRNCKPLEHITP